jgi:hypothetical protein
MAQSGKNGLNYRCPSCFMRDLDIDMFFDSDKQEYYCLRCQYTGTEEDILNKNEMIRLRYRDMLRRYGEDSFEDFDA